MLSHSSISGKHYSEDIKKEGIFDSIPCSCCPAVGSFYRHGFYTRTVVEPDLSTYTVEVLRLKCKSCGRTHAVLSDEWVPYYQPTAETILAAVYSHCAGEEDAETCRSPDASCRPDISESSFSPADSPDFPVIPPQEKAFCFFRSSPHCAGLFPDTPKALPAKLHFTEAYDNKRFCSIQTVYHLKNLILSQMGSLIYVLRKKEVWCLERNPGLNEVLEFLLRCNLAVFRRIHLDVHGSPMLFRRRCTAA